MHRYQFESGRRKSNPLKRDSTFAKREVSFEPIKKKKRHSASSRSSSVAILTSSRPNSSHSGMDNVNHNQPQNRDEMAVSTSKFYEIPKSLLEQQYEWNLSKFVPISNSQEFAPLESEDLEDLTVQKDEEAPDSKKDLDSHSRPQSVQPLQYSIEDLDSNSIRLNSFHVGYIVKLSSKFLAKAHKMVLKANDIAGAKTYFTYIRLAIKSLLLLLADYKSDLHPKLETAIYHKLANIYWTETEALDRAENYATIAISLATKYKFLKLKVMSELLFCQILELSNPKLLASLYTEKIEFYNKSELSNIADLFSLSRGDGVVSVDATVGSAIFNSLRMKENTHNSIRALSMLYEFNLLLYSTVSPIDEKLIQSVEGLVCTNYPPQITAIRNLSLLGYYVHIGDGKRGDEVIHKINNFISSQRTVGWPGWCDDGTFCLSLPASDTSSITIPYETKWLNADEFVIMFYFLNGMLDLMKGADFKETKKLFSSCLEIIELQLHELTSSESKRNFSIAHLARKVVKLNFIRFSTIYYKIWISFMHENDFSEISWVESFIKSFDANYFTAEEMSFYRLLIPKFLFLAGHYFQSRGDLFAAKFYYLRVRNHDIRNQSHISEVLFSQKTMGIGCESIYPLLDSSQLYLYATLHLLMIAEYESYSNLSKNALTEVSELSSHSWVNTLHSDVLRVLKRNENHLGSPGLWNSLHHCYELLSTVYMNKSLLTPESTMEIRKQTKFEAEKYTKDCTFIKSLASFVHNWLSFGQHSAIKSEDITPKQFIGDENNHLLQHYILSHSMSGASYFPGRCSCKESCERTNSEFSKLREKLNLARLSKSIG